MPLSFQTLPWDVAFDIICKVDDQRLLETDIISVVKEHKKSLILPLLQISEIWRKASLFYLLQFYQITFPQNNGYMSTKFKLWPRYMNKPDDYAFEYVKSVSIDVKVAAIASGCIMSTLKESSIYGQEFPNINSLELAIDNPDTKNYSLQDNAEDNIKQFFSFVTKKFMRAKNIKVVHRCIPSEHTAVTSTTSTISTLVHKLLGSARKSELELNTELTISETLLQPISSLTSLIVDWKNNVSNLATFIHHYSNQLEKLHIRYSTFNGMVKLVVDGKFNIMYPFLEELVLISLIESRDSPTMAFKSEGVLFPKLCHLQLGINYPFSDDTLFRGNSKTLEYLQMVSDIKVFDMLLELDIFSESKYLTLHHLTLGFHEYRGWSTRRFVNSAGPLPTRFIKCFMSTLQMFKFTVGCMDDLQLPDLEGSQIFPPKLKVLDLQYKELEIADIVSILKQLPMLVSLTCEYVFTGEHQISTQHANDLISRYYPLNNNFWHCKRATAEGAALLAILCPNFAHSEEPKHDRENFNHRLSKLMQCAPYNQYTDRIRSVMYKGPVVSTHVSAMKVTSNSDLVDSGHSEPEPEPEPEWSLFA